MLMTSLLCMNVIGDLGCKKTPSDFFSVNIEKILTSLAADLSAGNLIDITELARLAGLPYQTMIELSLARDYELEPDTPLLKRLDLFDLVWATNCVLFGQWPAHRRMVHPFRVQFQFELISYRRNSIEPDCFPVVADLQFHTEPGKLHLRLPDKLF